MKRYLPFVIIGGVLIVALAGGLLLWRSSQQTPSQPFVDSAPTPTATPPRPVSSSSTPVPQVTPVMADNGHARGGENAKVVIEEYGDYQCPPCGELFPELKTLEKQYGDQIRLVFRQFPLQMHKHAILAAKAAEAAGLQGRFWEMHDMLYQNQLSWSVAEDVRPVFLQYARMLGLDVDRFVRDIDGPEVSSRIIADTERGKAAGVEGTPTVFLNGRQLRPEVVTLDGLRMAIDYSLGKKK